MNNKLRKEILLALGVAVPSVVWMSTASAQGAGDDIEEYVVTGTRAAERSVTESLAPVDVLTAEYFTEQGGTDLNSLLRNVVPSYNVGDQPISDAATIVRPPNLRGLAPDHTLVLVNGKRRHRASVITWLGNGISNGSQGPDISAIPAIALGQVQVLRDGAAAQYGSDAIAGVMNFILKDDAEGGSLQVRGGSFFEGDGESMTIAGNIGLPFSENGFVNISVEYGENDPTDRSVQRDDAIALVESGNTFVANPAQIWGSPIIDNDFKSFVNIGLDLGGGKEFYSHGNVASKRVDGGFFFRNPNTRGGVFSADGGETLLIGDLLEAAGEGVGAANCPTVNITDNVPDPVALQQVFDDPNCFSFQEMFPGGFTPRFGGEVDDRSLVAGVRGEMNNGLIWDISSSFGRNEVDFFINNTVNASLGPATPTSFDPGAYIQIEQSFNADFSYPVTDSFNVAFGAEQRSEEFEIRVGDEESFTIGDLASQGFSASSNGFPGFSNIAGGQFSRDNVALYVDAEWDATDSLLFGAAIRWEDFDDFGTTTNGKLGVNWRATPNFGLRATASTGFKAPTPGQSNAFNVSTEFDAATGDLINNGTVPSTTEVALLRGGRPLDAEESTSFAAGIFFNIGALDVTLDYFHIEVDDRLNLSQEFTLTETEVESLLAAGVTSAANLQNFRFFTNDFNTETTGFDLVASYPIEWGSAGITDVSFSFNMTETEVTDFGVTVGERRIQELEEGLPESRWILTANHSIENFSFLVRASFYDEWYDTGDDFTYGDEMIFDIEAQWHATASSTFVLGAQNITDENGEENPNAGSVGNQYSSNSPFGFNGGYWYARYQYTF